MKFFIPCFLLVFGCFIHHVSAQNDSLINVLEKTLQAQIDNLGAEHSDIAVYCDSLGKMYIGAANYAQADSLFHQALDIKLKKNEVDSLDIADSYYNLGNISIPTGDYKKAISLHNKALNIRLEILGKKHPDVGKSYNSIGIIYDETGDLEKAIAFYNKALNIWTEAFGEKHPNVGKSYNNLGITYYIKGNYEKAIAFFNKTLKISLKLFGEKHPDVARCYNNLAGVYYATDDYEKAISFQNKALNIRLEILGKKHPGIAMAYSNLGNAYNQISNYEKAISFQNKALNIWLEVFGEEHNAVAMSYNNLGDVYYQTGDYEKAISFQNKALNIQLEIFDEEYLDIIYSYCSLAIAYEKSSQYQTADSLWYIAVPKIAKRLKSTYLYLDNDQRIKYSNTLIPIINDFYSFAAIHDSESTTQLATNFLLNTKSLALEYAVSTGQLIKSINDSTLVTQYEQLNQLNKQIANAEQLTNEERQAKSIDLFEIRNQQEALTFQVLQHPQLKSKLNAADIKWQDIQHHLEPEEVTIDFLKIYEQKDSLWAYYAILIAKLLKTGKNERPYYLNDRRTAKALYRSLWQPIGQYLEDIKTVYISPSGVLHRVPFESLRDETNEYLVEQYEFHYYPTIRDLPKEKQQKTTYKDMVLMGHILYDLDQKDNYEAEEEDMAFRGNTRDSIQPLPETLREVTKIKRTAKRAGLKTKLLTIDAASEDAVQYFIKDNAPSIFHFAHGQKAIRFSVRAKMASLPPWKSPP